MARNPHYLAERFPTEARATAAGFTDLDLKPIPAELMTHVVLA